MTNYMFFKICFIYLFIYFATGEYSTAVDSIDISPYVDHSQLLRPGTHSCSLSRSKGAQGLIHFFFVCVRIMNSEIAFEVRNVNVDEMITRTPSRGIL